MKTYLISFFLYLLTSTANAAGWKLISSNDGFWIKTTNNQHQLLLAYHNNQAQFLLILKTDSPMPDRSLDIKLKIDKSPWSSSKLTPLEQRAEHIIFRIEVDDNIKNNIITRMIAGINWSISFDSAATLSAHKNKTISFSLHGFTVALNDLLIANQTGSLDSNWLLKHKKDRELYCLLTSNISIQAMEYRLQGLSYTKTLNLIPKTHYSIIDHNLGEIINQVYKLPIDKLPYVPRAEKYLMFSRCMQQPFK